MPYATILRIGWMKNWKYFFVLVDVIIIKIFLQVYAINSVFELHRDEYLHVDLGHHLSWGYASVPRLPECFLLSSYSSASLPARSYSCLPYSASSP